MSRRTIGLLCLFLAMTCCGNRFNMGFSPVLGPTPWPSDTEASNDMWAHRADAQALQIEIPWKLLLTTNEQPSHMVARVYAAPVGIMRSKYKISVLYVGLDVTNHLNRAEEAPELIALNRSITERSIQHLYVSYALAVASVLQPSKLGLAVETNMIRLMAQSPVWNAVVQMTNLAASALGSSSPPLFVTLQAEVAWGVLHGNGSYVGVDEDVAVFPFAKVFGISTYPQFSYATPAQIPKGYFARLLQRHPTRSLFVSESGWSSFNNSEGIQQAYMERMGDFIKETPLFEAFFQLSFPDMNLTAFFPPPQRPPPGLDLFALLGLVDASLKPKPALSVWDSLFNEQ